MIEAQQMEGRLEREVILEGEVEISRTDMQLTADRARYDMVEDEVHIVGNVWMKRPGQTYSGDELRLKMDTGTGYVLNPTYQMDANNGRGSAERIDFVSREQALVTAGTYSTCEGPDPDWYLSADTLDLDTARDIGTARSARLYFKGVPILGSPYVSFPLSGERKSGFLPPTIGTSNTGGLEVMVPYYFNIAPNRDLTLYPKLISRRGLQLGADARYLGETYNGQTKLEFLNDDQLTNSERWAVSSVHTQRITPNLSFRSNLNAASDDEYPNDFPSTLTEATHRLLAREAQMNYAGSYWNLMGRATSYQVLQDTRALEQIGRPYARLPQLAFNAAQYNVGGFDWSVLTEATRFWHPDQVDGNRFVFQPRISYPIIRQSYFFKPSLSLHASHYGLERSDGRDSINRVLPTFSMDSGLTFERDTTYFGKQATQTLEPRLFYVYTPYRSQSDIPQFDTAPLDFSFAELFSESRYSGHDRINDANQITAAVTSRFLGETGTEHLRLTLAQRFYFKDQRVYLEDERGTDNALNSGLRSDILLAAAGQVSPTVSINTILQYNEALKEISRATYGLSWRPGPRRVLNVNYRLDEPNDLEQFDISGQWPLAARWYGVGRVNYSMREGKIAEGLLGFEYRADCWIFRMVGQRTPTATGVATTAFYFQLELSGLSRLGSDPLDALRDNISGYQMVSQP